MGGEVRVLELRFTSRQSRHDALSPDLAVGMRIGGSHGGASVLERLHPCVPGSQFGHLLSEEVDHRADRSRGSFGKRQIVAGGETHHSARTRHTLGGEERTVRALRFCVRQQRREVVGEDERRVVCRIPDATGTFVARTEVARWVVGRSVVARRCFFLPLPRPVSPVSRDENPVAGEGIATAMGTRWCGDHDSHPG